MGAPIWRTATKATELLLALKDNKTRNRALIFPWTVFPIWESFISFSLHTPTLIEFCLFSLSKIPSCVKLRSGSLSQVISTHNSLRNNWLIRGICLGAVSLMTAYTVVCGGSNGGRIYPFFLLREILCVLAVQPQAVCKVKDWFAEGNSEMG